MYHEANGHRRYHINIYIISVDGENGGIKRQKENRIHFKKV